jgi:hypothetical protein
MHTAFHEGIHVVLNGCECVGQGIQHVRARQDICLGKVVTDVDRTRAQHLGRALVGQQGQTTDDFVQQSRQRCQRRCIGGGSDEGVNGILDSQQIAAGLFHYLTDDALVLGLSLRRQLGRAHLASQIVRLLQRPYRAPVAQRRLYGQYGAGNAHQYVIVGSCIRRLQFANYGNLLLQCLLQGGLPHHYQRAGETCHAVGQRQQGCCGTLLTTHEDIECILNGGKLLPHVGRQGFFQLCVEAADTGRCRISGQQHAETKGILQFTNTTTTAMGLRHVKQQAGEGW